MFLTGKTFFKKNPGVYYTPPSVTWQKADFYLAVIMIKQTLRKVKKKN